MRRICIYIYPAHTHPSEQCPINPLNKITFGYYIITSLSWRLYIPHVYWNLEKQFLEYYFRENLFYSKIRWTWKYKKFCRSDHQIYMYIYWFNCYCSSWRFSAAAFTAFILSPARRSQSAIRPSMVFFVVTPIAFCMTSGKIKCTY